MTLEEYLQDHFNRRNIAAEARELKRRFSYAQTALLSDVSMFTYNGLPESMPEEFIETYFDTNGCIASCIDRDGNGKLIVTRCGLASKPDAYGRGTKALCSTLNGHVYELTDMVDCAVGWNNALYAPDDLIFFAADQLAEIDLSLHLNVLYTRLKPILTAADDKTRAIIEKAFADIVTGAPLTITSSNMLEELAELGVKNIDKLELTDPELADKMQYLVKAHDDVTRWIYTLYGQAIQGGGKIAQQSVDEVNGATSTSFIIPNNKLKYRRAWVDKTNRLFGTEISVDFSDAWKIEHEKYIEDLDEMLETGDVVEEETAPLEKTEGETETKEANNGEEVL
jgi:hypothetical protein